MTNNTCMCINDIFTLRKTISKIKTFFPLVTSFTWHLRSVYQRAVQSTEVICVSSERSDQRSHPALALLPAFSQIMWCSTSSLQSNIPEQQEAVSVVTLDLHTAHNRSQLRVKGVWRNIWNRLMFWRLTPPAGAHERTRDYWVTILSISIP